MIFMKFLEGISHRTKQSIRFKGDYFGYRIFLYFVLDYW